MSVKNPFYGEMERNPICLNLPWKNNDDEVIKRWENGKTGYPFIDAVMRQLHQVSHHLQFTYDEFIYCLMA